MELPGPSSRSSLEASTPTESSQRKRMRLAARSRLHLDITPMSETPGPALVVRRNLFPSAALPPMSKKRRFRLSPSCGPSLDLARELQRRSSHHQNQRKGIKNASILTSIKLVYKYSARSFSELYDLTTADEFASLCMNKDYVKSVQTAIELFVKDSLELQRINRWEYLLSFAKYLPDEEYKLLSIFENSNIDIHNFVRDLKCVLMCDVPKMNTLKMYGEPNSGKTTIARLIVSKFVACYANNRGTENEFYLENFLNKSIILCDELFITHSSVEDFKSVLGGAVIDIDKKYLSKQLLSRTPVICTSNYRRFGRGHLPPTDERALCTRCYLYNFDTALPENFDDDGINISVAALAHLLWNVDNHEILL